MGKSVSLILDTLSIYLVEISAVERLVGVDHLLPPGVRVGRQVVYHYLVPSLYTLYTILYSNYKGLFLTL